MKTYKELKIWQKSMDIVTEIYHLTINFPDEEKFGLTNQNETLCCFNSFKYS